MKILIIKRDKLGDLLLTTPMLAHLRECLPQAEIHLLANDYNAWVVADEPTIDRRWIYPRVRVGSSIRVGAAFRIAWQMLQLRRERFDWAVVANGSESSRAIARGLQSGARRVVAYTDSPGRWPHLSDPLPVPRAMHEADRLIALLAPLGIAPPATPILPRYTLPAEAQRYATHWLAERRLAPRGYIVLGLGARRAKKQPTTGQILRWTRHLKGVHGLDTVFMWTPGHGDNPLYPGDDDVAEPVVAAREPQIHPFRGPILPALGLIWNARGSILPDSGLMHFAAASPGGVLGLFAETDVSPHPDQWGPRGRNVDYLDADRNVADLDDSAVLSRVEALFLR